MKIQLHADLERKLQVTLISLIAEEVGINAEGVQTAKFAKSINVEVGINVEGGIFWKKLVHNSNKRGVEGGKKSKKSINVEGEIFQTR